MRGTFVLLFGLVIAGASAVAQDAGQIEAGRKLYERERCATCHQIGGRGNRLFPLDGVGARLSVADIRRWFTHTAEMERALPKRPAILMSSRKYAFKDADLDALVAYLASLKPST